MGSGSQLTSDGHRPYLEAVESAFGAQIEHHMAAVAINYFAYNFCKIHTSLRMTRAMAAGDTTRLMDMSDLVAMLVESEAEKAA